MDRVRDRSVGADEQIAVGRCAVREVGVDPIAVQAGVPELLAVFDAYSPSQCLVAQGAVEVCAAQRLGRRSERGEASVVELGQLFPASADDPHSAGVHPESGDLTIEIQYVQSLQTVGREGQECAHAVRAVVMRFVHHGVESGPLHGHRRDRSGDASSYDRHLVSHKVTIHKMTNTLSRICSTNVLTA